MFVGDAALHDHFREYVLGLTYAALHRDADAERLADRLDYRVTPEGSREIIRSLAHGVRARVRYEHRDAGASLRELQLVQGERTPSNLIGVVPFYGFTAGRFLHAEALHALGRDEEALSWYGSFGEHSAFSRVYLAPAHRRQAEIYEKLGRRADAARHLAEFIALWKDCDSELRAEVTEAQARLTRLRSELRGR